MKGYCTVKKAKKSAFDPRSFRWVKSGKAKVLIGCPRGKWNAKQETCSVGTRAYEVLTPGACRPRAKSKGLGAAAHRSGLVAKRSAVFRDEGTYDVFDASGKKVAVLFRDPETRWWYEDNKPGKTDYHFTDRWRGFTKDEALDSLASRPSKIWGLGAPGRSKFKTGDRISFSYAGERFGKRGAVEHVRKDGLIIVHFDDDPPGAILVVQPFEIDKVPAR